VDVPEDVAVVHLAGGGLLAARVVAHLKVRDLAPGAVDVRDDVPFGAASLMSPTEKQFDYVEHLLFGLRSITYYGTTR
jgi:hypothetical protein